MGDILNGTFLLSSLSEMYFFSFVYVESRSSTDPATLKNLPFKTKLGAGKSKEKNSFFFRQVG